MHDQLKKINILLLFIISFLSLSAQNRVSIVPNATLTEIEKAAVSVRPGERQLNWHRLEYYAFFHFGTNTFLDKEWGDGTADPSVFNPTELDARQWVKAIKAAGMKGAIITAKHHDGFCLWPTKTTSYSVKNSPWRNGKGDLVRELADACRKEGIKLGIYLSPWDRNHPTYGNSPEYNKIFLAQLTELLTNYGELFEVWFDGACGEEPNGKTQVYDWDAYYALIRKLQPNAVIAIMGPDVRWCGNEAGKGRDPEWNVLPVNARSQKSIADNSQKEAGDGVFVPKINPKDRDLGSLEKLKGASSLVWYPAEVDVSIRKGWFYHALQDNAVKTDRQLEDIYYSSVGMNASLLLNIPPDRRGLIHENDIKSLMGLKKILDQTFKTNLVRFAEIKAGVSSGSSKCGRMADSDLQTFWMDKTAGRTPTIELNFSVEKKFDRLLLQEYIRNGQRVESFVLEIKENGQWRQIVQGNTIGYKRILRFPVVSAQHIRIRVTASRDCPQLSEIGIYNSGQ